MNEETFASLGERDLETHSEGERAIANADFSCSPRHSFPAHVGPSIRLHARSGAIRGFVTWSMFFWVGARRAREDVKKVVVRFR